jgi:competence protein ComFB
VKNKMLITPHTHKAHAESASGSVHNYYERLVFEQLRRASDRAAADPNFMADVACVALNRLPPRYVRHDVDMTFFLSPIEHDEILDKVARAVNEALTYVEGRGKGTSN